VFFERNRLSPEARQALEDRFGKSISCGPDYVPGDDELPF
jgi:hypothetical protein